MARLVTAEDSAASRVKHATRVDPTTGAPERPRRSGRLPRTGMRHDLLGRLLWPMAVAGGCLAVLMGLVAVTLDVELGHAAPSLADSSADAWSSFLGYLLLVGLAELVLRRERRHPVGWLLLLLALLTGAEGVSAQLGVLGLHLRGHDVVAAAAWAAVSESLQRPEFGVALAILAVFPDGHVPSRRWRWLVWALLVVFPAWFLVHLLRPEPLEEAPFQGLANPLGLRWLGGATLHFFFLPAAGVLALAVVWSMVVRFHRSRGDERQQLKWLGVLAAGLPVGLVALGVSQFWGPAAMGVAGDAVWLFMSIGLPLAVVVAITRYRLYDLDLLVNRTVVYGAVSVVVLTTYAMVCSWPAGSSCARAGRRHGSWRARRSPPRSSQPRPAAWRSPGSTGSSVAAPGTRSGRWSSSPPGGGSSRNAPRLCARCSPTPFATRPSKSASGSAGRRPTC